MPRIKKFNLPQNSNMNAIIDIAAQNLSMQGYDVKSQVIGPTAAELIVTKDRDGLKNFVGLGIESRVAITADGNSITLSMTDEWTNKIIAIAIGLFLCWITLVTGIIGLVNQSGLNEKIDTAFNLAVNSGISNIPPQAPSQQQAAPTEVEFTEIKTEEIDN